MKKISVLAVGHSYALSVNRAVLREVAKDPTFEITAAGPAFFHGDLRSGHFDPEPVDSPLSVKPIPARWSKRIHMFHYSQSALRQLMQPSRFQAVHVWEEPYIAAGYQLSRQAKQRGIPFCFWSAQNLSKWYPLPFSYFEKFCVRSADHWIACGTSVNETLLSRGYPAERGSIATLAVDTSLFRPLSESARRVTREKLGLTNPVIGFMGRLVPDKGLSILMRALDALDPHLAWSLLLLGSGAMKEEIEQWARNRGWSERVKIVLAKHGEVPELLAAMDVMVAPSQTMPNWKEQFGRMLIEALACGVPVIASDSGEIPYVMGQAGVIVPEKDVQAWAVEIDRLLRDPELRARMSAAGLERVPRFSAAVVAQQYREIYRELAGGNRGRKEPLIRPRFSSSSV